MSYLGQRAINLTARPKRPAKVPLFNEGKALKEVKIMLPAFTSIPGFRCVAHLYVNKLVQQWGKNQKPGMMIM